MLPTSLCSIFEYSKDVHNNIGAYFPILKAKSDKILCQYWSSCLTICLLLQPPFLLLYLLMCSFVFFAKLSSNLFLPVVLLVVFSRDNPGLIWG